MELRHLRYFLAVAEELHFTRAAERLHIGQPPLSQQIQALEAELGAPLFRRHQRKVELTAAGQQLLPRARQILADSAAAAAAVRRAADGETGELRIGFTSSLPLTPILHHSLQHYRQAYPEVRLTLSEMFTAGQFDALERRQLDLGFVRFNGPTPSPLIRVEELHRDRLLAVVPSAHPLAERKTLPLKLLAGEPLIGYPRESGSGLSDVVRQLALQNGLELKMVQEAGEAITQIGLVAAGVGIAILPSPLECVQIPAVRYVPLSDDGAYLSMGIAVRRDDDSPLVANFLSGVRGG
ncbi:DNA-binding transcriptional regulator, LysR family [Chromobacterium violaceum]|uniref:Ben and cat operon transcriptional regulator n=1 Tax=Chromobacterium violaceum TaxID=536 RepID=A0A202B308_CHRVL|nr:LysR family transcriptional regulator [Chromobacterium violaceum]KJH66957.1 LysR family transcriptional regulator [Chromobacterium violaceum]KMN47745.1 LysR family transcriptional regulator [Chromobacterium violaceum]KMN84621.1 LysR family transcriptional regulator [Chromobacterium violaceum]KMN89163.1 LysR family transcriptional regulator [Chromobacterium violaceum]KMO02685.1 LysR family transcriptional regulator [Chromobacterium violaceum]